MVKSFAFNPNDEQYEILLKQAENEILLYEKYCQDD